MSKIIADTYELQKEIGSGGGGIVYLAYHKRLNKNVVLKADKHTLTAGQEMLRREVDILKNLSHTYIPQVYDFFAVGDTVYTVMDYIEGESFDHILERGQRFSQAQIIEWACQLLDALCYLHSRKPHGILHGDIKPANIMLTPDNDIRLIDFNIALALGEEGAVRVGYSRGYASPEHYGIEYSHYHTEYEVTDKMTVTMSDADETFTMADDTLTLAEQSSGSTSGSGAVLLDARSDIYSLGATLYHLITGKRPSKNAEKREAISRDDASQAVIDIIEKAMQPDPALRFQSAEEMLQSFLNLHRNDSRYVKFCKVRRTTACVLLIVFLVGGMASFTGLKQMENLKNSYLLAEKSENALEAGDVAKAISLAESALPLKKNIFSAPYTAEAQKALTDALGVYDLSDGYKNHGVVTLPAETLKLAMSPDGKYAAAIADNKLLIVDTDTCEIKASLPAEESALSDVVFADEKTLIYAGTDGITAYDTDSMSNIWTGKKCTGISVSADGTKAAAVYKDETKACIYDVKTGALLQETDFRGRKQSVAVNDTFADPEDSLFSLNNDGSMLAASFSDGSLSIFDLSGSDGDIDIYDASDYTHFEGGFYGKYFAFSSQNQQESVFTVIDTVELAETGGFTIQTPLGVRTDESGIYLSTEDVAVKIDPETGYQTEMAYIPGTITAYDRTEGFTVAAGDDNTYRFFDSQANEINCYTSDSASDFVVIAGNTAAAASLSSPELRIMKLESHEETQLFSYPSEYLHDEARISADGKTVMLFSYDNFRLYNTDGTLICEQSIPDAEQVYDQQYRRKSGESYLEVIYNDGMIRRYSASDGSLVSEDQGEKPDLTLYEEFMTDNLRITSPLHGTPEVYDISTGKKITELESDDYLTYVTQTGDYIIAEYITADDVRYGLLMNEKCETLARLPYLCDIVDGELIFDYRSGNLRKTRIYSIDELIAIGQSILKSD
jgi:serine/threonine protein kinase